VTDLLVDTSAMKVRQLVVHPSDGSGNSDITLPVDQVDLRPNAREVFVRDRAGAGFDWRSATPYTGYTGSSSTESAAGEAERRLTRTEEELKIGKREVARGEVRIGKHVETERVNEPVTRRREEVVIERRPVDGNTPADARTIGDAEVRIPLMEEEVIVEKRPVVKEELVVGKRVVEERDTVEAEVRREEFDIDNPTEGDSRSRSPRTNKR
jgi:uncharacterized protein (TIGR02271 family)